MRKIRIAPGAISAESAPREQPPRGRRAAGTDALLPGTAWWLSRCKVRWVAAEESGNSKTMSAPRRPTGADIKRHHALVETRERGLNQKR